MSALILLASSIAPVAAIGYSMIYMLFGGGLVGAIIIFIVAKMFRR